MKNSKKDQAKALAPSASRREFCRNTALFTGAMVLPVMPMHSMVNNSNDKTLKIALVGCGGRGTGAASQALKADENVELVAMADAFEDRLQSSLDNLLKEFEGTKKVNVKEKSRFVGFDAAKKAMDMADVVILATPPGFRPQHFEYAVNTGKHIFMEKPVATDVPGIQKVLASAKIAKDKKLNVVVGLQRHYQKNYIEFNQQIKEGKIGKIVSGQVYWDSSGVWVRERQPGQSELEYQMRNWYYFNWLCGDHIVEQHVHNIDVANWIKNKYPVSAYGAGGRFLRTGKDYGEIYDSHSIEFVYDDGSVISSQCRHYTGGANRIDESFQGTKGKIYLGSNGNGNIWDHKGKVLLNYDGKADPNPYQTEHDELFAAVAANKFKFSDAENAAKSTMTAILGRYASYSGNLVKWDEAINSEISLMPDNLAWDALPKVLPNFDGTYPYAIPGVSKVV